LAHLPRKRSGAGDPGRAAGKYKKNVMSERYDIVIRDTTIVDGSGAPAFHGSVGIKGQRVVAVGAVEGEAARVIDGAGLITCPGFVDPHTHVDVSLHRYPLAENMVMQGITTCVGGNCGLSIAPIRHLDYIKAVMGDPDELGLEVNWRTFDEWLSCVEAHGAAVNYVPLVGHSAIRGAVMGTDFMRHATPTELEEIVGLVDEAMQAGAFGLSAGIDMPWPGYYAAFDELVAAVGVVQAYDGVFTPHTRHLRNLWPTDDPSELLYTAYDGPKAEVFAGRYHGLVEVVEICQQAHNARLHIAHMPLAYVIPQPHPAFLDDAIARATLAEIVDKARQEGPDLTYNVIAAPYTIAGEVPLLDLFFKPMGPPPAWLASIQTLGKEAFLTKLETWAFRAEMKSVIASGRFKFGMIHPATDPYWMDRYTILRCKNKRYEGATIGALARRRQPGHTLQMAYDTSFEVLFDVLVEDPETTWVLNLDNRGTPGTQAIFLQHPAGMPCTDVGAMPAAPPPQDLFGGYGLSPTTYGLYPGYIQTFVKERAALSLEEAIQKASSVPAGVFGLQDRGLVKEGAYADLVVFDLARIAAANDFLEPARPPQGIEHVLVNGSVVYENQAHTGAKPGQVLRRR